MTEALETALPVLASISIQLHTRLDLIQKHFNLFRTDTTKDGFHLMQNPQPVPNALQFEANIVEESNAHARASLYVYLNAAVSTLSHVTGHRPSSLLSFVDGPWWTTPP